MRVTRAALMLGIMLMPTLALAWTGPSSSPPNGNVAAPINAGSNGQVKSGDFATLGKLGVGTPAPSWNIDVTGTVGVRNNWSSNDIIGINGNQVWNQASGNALYLQWANPGGQVIVGGQGGATNGLTVNGGITARDSVTSPSYCIGASCITSWASGVGGTGTTNYVPRWSAATTLANSSLSSDGSSATSNGNFFVTGNAYHSGLSVVSNSGSKWFGLEPEQTESPAHGSIVNAGTARLIQFNLDAPYTAAFGGPITTGGSVTAGQFCIGASCVSSWTTGTIGGSGSTNYMPRWTGATSLGNSSISSDGSSATSNGNFFAPLIYDSNNNGYYLDPNNTSNINALTVSNINTVNCIASVCPPNAAIRMTPNFHLNAGAGYAVIVNWDNNTTGASQAFRVGNGAGADSFYVTANGQAVATANVQTPTLCLNGDCRSAWPSTAGTVGGSGTSGYVPRYTAGTTLGNSSITSDGSSSTANGNFFATDFYSNGGWFRATGNTGLYWQSWGSGFNMTDAGWIRSYGPAGLWMGSANIGTNGGITAGYGGAGAPAGGAIFSGTVGIGTNNPTEAKLQVWGGTYSGSFSRDGQTECCASGATLSLAENTAGTGKVAGIQFHDAGVSEAYLQLANGGARRFQIGDNQGVTTGLQMSGPLYVDSGAVSYVIGNLGVGTGSPTEKLTVNGNVLATAFLYSSDRRLKDNIVPLSDSLQKLSQISGVSFVWRPGTPKAGQSDIGVIAQDVQKVVPEAVVTKSDGYEAVDYARLVPLLISAVNDQQKEIDDLKAQVAALQNK